MKDAKGRELGRGDVAFLPVKFLGGADGRTAVVTPLADHPDNLNAWDKLVVSPAQLIRANEGDDTKFRVVDDGGRKIIA